MAHDGVAKNSLQGSLIGAGSELNPLNQWLWDQIYPGLAHLYLMGGLMMAPKDDEDLNDRVLRWADQFSIGHKWDQSPAEERAIDNAFRVLANSCTQWPAPAGFWQVFRAPGQAPVLPPHRDHGVSERLPLEGTAAQIRGVLDRLPGFQERLNFLLACVMGPKQAHAPLSGPHQITVERLCEEAHKRLDFLEPENSEVE